MKKILSIMIGLCVAVLSVVAQTVPETSQGFNMGSATENNISVVVGQPFGGLFAQNGYEVAEGVTQAQLVRESYGETVNYGDGYAGHGFSYPATTPAGTHQDSRYDVGGAQYGYDLLTELTLQVLNALVCPATVEDGDHNLYDVVAVVNRCWTKQNLKPTHYADGTTEIEGAMAYHNPSHPDEEANVAIYGRLYTWVSAVNAAADGTVTPGADGYVQGICPDGWHIPTKTEMDALKALPAEEIRTAELWVTPNANTNSTGFTALPAGRYNAALTRYEGLSSQTDWWSVTDAPSSGSPVTSLSVVYYCDSPIDGTPAAADGLSVRCVKNS